MSRRRTILGRRRPVRAAGAVAAISLKTWPVVALALGGLLLLVVLSILATRRKAHEIYTQLDELNMLHRDVEAKMRRLRSDVHLSGIFVRDYLLDNSHLSGPAYRERLTDLRTATTANVAALNDLIGHREEERMHSLTSKLEDYWQAFGPLFDWTPAQKGALSSGFLRKVVLPRREAVLNIAQQIEELNNANMADQRAQVALRQQELDTYVTRMLWGRLALGIAVAVIAVLRIRLLEQRSIEQRESTERAEQEMRRLSHQLVGAQEDERKRLSRELHDEVGQMLTALRMELGKAERARTSPDGRFSANLAECKRLIETMVHTVRGLAMGLRPAMLDDLGLEPALNWQARDFSRRYNVPVNLVLTGDLDRLPESHRTCVYRVLQEALTNCARHANARRIEVVVEGRNDMLSMEVRDDGVGITDARTGGLGLIGIQERVREIHGRMTLVSPAGGGTALRVELPVPHSIPEPELANPLGG